MKIRKKQMAFLEQVNLAQYETRIALFLQNKFPDVGKKTTRELLTAIHEQVERSKTYGFCTEQQIAGYVTTAWMLGQNFDTEFPVAGDVLMSDMAADDKAAWLAQWTEELFSSLDNGNS